MAKRQMSANDTASRRYDGQATTYDDRTAIAERAACTVAAAVLAIAGGRRTVVEIGAGTGELGRQFAALPCRYVGLDLSRAMLARFQAKLGEDAASASLVQAECNRAWPLRDGAADAVIAMRVVHLLDAKLVAAEAKRVCRLGGFLLIGRVEHDESGLRERLRRERQRRFAEHGVHLPGGRQGGGRLIERCAAAGATLLGRRQVAEWVRPTITAANVIAAWDAVDAWAGRPVEPVVQAEVQNALRGWAEAEFGSLDHGEPCIERFFLDVVRFP